MPGKIQLSHFDLIGFVFDLIGFGATSPFAYFLYFYVLTGLIMLLRHDSLRSYCAASVRGAVLAVVGFCRSVLAFSEPSINESDHMTLGPKFFSCNQMAVTLRRKHLVNNS